jgi:hypothetical protein
MKREIVGDDIFFHDARWLGGIPREVTRFWANVLVTPTGELAAFANASVQKRYASQLTKYDVYTSEFGGSIHTAITA